jgi:hypothetical protein
LLTTKCYCANSWRYRPFPRLGSKSLLLTDILN